MSSTGAATSYGLIFGTKGKGRSKSIPGALRGAQGVVLDFFFTMDDANELAADLRSAAAEWAAAFQDGKPSEPARWQELHEEGARCFRVVFNDAADDVAKFLAAAPADADIWVQQQTADLVVPWGLLCSPCDVHRAAERPLAPQLWAAKYNVRTQLEHGRASRLRHSSWGFETVVCKPTYHQDLSKLPNASAPFARSLHARSLHPRQAFREQGAPPNCFIYVHSHTQDDRGNLVFKPSDTTERTITRKPIEIVQSVVPVRSGGAALAVLNACHSANGFRGMAPALVLESCNIEVACIATEILADRRFATEFGLELIDRCVQQGESPSEAMKVLRRKHYPMSIIYSHYCKADLKIDRPMGVFPEAAVHAYRVSIADANYSFPHSAGTAR